MILKQSLWYLLTRFSRGFRPTPLALLQTLRLSALALRSQSSPGSVLVTGPARLKIRPGARLRIASGGRLTIGSGGTQDVFDADEVRCGLYLGPDSELTVSGKVRLSFGTKIRLGRGAKLSVGDGVMINAHTKVFAFDRISIGPRCAIGWQVTLMDSSAHSISLEHGETWSEICAPIDIQEHVWIGANATILKGVTVGANSVVAAGAVVTRDVPADSMVAGVPARVVRQGIDWRG